MWCQTRKNVSFLFDETPPNTQSSEEFLEIRVKRIKRPRRIGSSYKRNELSLKTSKNHSSVANGLQEALQSPAELALRPREGASTIPATYQRLQSDPGIPSHTITRFGHATKGEEARQNLACLAVLALALLISSGILVDVYFLH